MADRPPIETLQKVWGKLDIYKASVQRGAPREMLNTIRDRLLEEIHREIESSAGVDEYFLGQCLQVDSRYYRPQNPQSN